jgi:hypothetical protein
VTTTIKRARVILILLGGAALLAWGQPSRACASDGSGADPLYRQNLERARAVALQPSQRPTRFIVADYVLGPAKDATTPVAPQTLDDALETLRLLGINTVEAKLFGTQTARIGQRAAELGFFGFRRAIAEPQGIFAWESGLRPVEVERWARAQAQETRTSSGTPPAQVRLFHIADELGWYYPKVLQQLRSSPTGVRMFRAYLRRRGFGPGAFGAGSWAAVSPLAQSRATTLPRRRLFYWTVRFVADSVSGALRRDTLALRRHFSPGLLTTTNWNNRVSISYYRAPGRKIGNNPTIGPDSAMGSMHWMDVGRESAVTTMWSEDWFPDRDAQMWGVYADGLRAAAQRARRSFGGYIVGRELGGLPAGGKYKALTLIGHGAKVIEWYTFGPEERFAGNGYSNNLSAYREIADANRLIAAGEGLLYPGRPPQPKVALLVSRSAQLWHRSAQRWPADTRPPIYEKELYGIHHALTHAQYQVDYLDEQAVASGELRRRGYRVLYATAPNVALGAQRAIRSWVQQGGVVAFAPGAASADEYNSHTTVLASLRGRSARGRAAVRRLGRGRAVSYGFWAGNDYYRPASRSALDRLPSGWSAAKRHAATLPARLAGVTKPVTTDVEVVEAQRLDSAGGTAVVLLNWTGTPISTLTVRVRSAGAIGSASSVESGNLSVSRVGSDALVRLPLRDVDVLMLRR